MELDISDYLRVRPQNWFNQTSLNQKFISQVGWHLLGNYHCWCFPSFIWSDAWCCAWWSFSSFCVVCFGACWSHQLCDLSIFFNVWVWWSRSRHVFQSQSRSCLSSICHRFLLGSMIFFLEYLVPSFHQADLSIAWDYRWKIGWPTHKQAISHRRPW